MPDIITSSCPQDSHVVMCHVVLLAASLSGKILQSKFTIFCWAPICPRICVFTISLDPHNTLRRQTSVPSNFRLGYWSPKRLQIDSTSRLVSPLHWLYPSTIIIFIYNRHLICLKSCSRLVILIKSESINWQSYFWPHLKYLMALLMKVDFSSYTKRQTDHFGLFINFFQIQINCLEGNLRYSRGNNNIFIW